MIYNKKQTQEIAPLALHHLRLERNISPHKLGIGYHKYLSCAIWAATKITGKNYQDSMSELDTAFLQYPEKFNEDNKSNYVKAQKLKEKKIRVLRDIRKTFYHYNVLVFWLNKNKYSVELQKLTNYGKVIEEDSSGNIYFCISKIKFDITTINVSKKGENHLSFACKKAMKKEPVGYDKLERETNDNNRIIIILNGRPFCMNLRDIESNFFSVNAKKYLTIYTDKKGQYRVKKTKYLQKFHTILKVSSFI